MKRSKIYHLIFRIAHWPHVATCGGEGSSLSPKCAGPCRLGMIPPIIPPFQGGRGQSPPLAKWEERGLGRRWVVTYLLLRHPTFWLRSCRKAPATPKASPPQCTEAVSAIFANDGSERTHVPYQRLLGASALLALALLLAACRQPGPVPTASPEERDLLIRAGVRAAALTSYRSIASVTIRYDDGVEKATRVETLAQYLDVPPDSERNRALPRGFFSCSDPLFSQLTPVGMTSPQTVCYRQPGDWGRPQQAVEHLASATDLWKLGEETADGQAIAHYRATFSRRPDLGKFRAVMIGTERHDAPLLMRDIYDDAPQTVDAWLGKEDLLLRRIDIVTTGLVYPLSMPEPNNLKGAVEERASVFFRDYDRSSLGFPFGIAVPTGLRAVPLPDKPAIQLTWSDNADNETAYAVQRSRVSDTGPWEQIAFLPANITSFVDENVSEGVAYFYRVSANGATTTSPFSEVLTAVWVAR